MYLPGVTGQRREDADKEAAKNYALLIADTVLVRERGATPEVLTLACPKAWAEVAYYLKVRGSSTPTKLSALPVVVALQ
jgi:hypothetical protein